jgi:hypothetical protein
MRHVGYQAAGTAPENHACNLSLKTGKNWKRKRKKKKNI